MAAPRFQRGDIINFNTPYADGGGGEHPSLIVSDPLCNGHGDYILIQIVSKDWGGRCDYRITESHADFSATGLHAASTFRCHKLFVIAESMARRKRGVAGPDIMRQIDAKLKLALDLR